MTESRGVSLEARKNMSEARMRVVRETPDMPLPITKKCRGKCGEVLPRDAFYTRRGKVRKTDGKRTVYLEPYCKECTKQRVREARQKMVQQMTPEEKRDYNRRKRARFIQRHGIQRRREIDRMSKAKKRMEEGREKQYVRKSFMYRLSQLQNDPDLDVVPFREWLERKLPVYWDGRETVNASKYRGLGALAAACGVSDRQLRRVLDGEEGYTHTVELKLVDTCLTNEGSTQMWELYGDIEEEQLQAA